MRFWDVVLFNYAFSSVMIASVMNYGRGPPHGDEWGVIVRSSALFVIAAVVAIKIVLYGDAVMGFVLMG